MRNAHMHSNCQQEYIYPSNVLSRIRCSDALEERLNSKQRLFVLTERNIRFVRGNVKQKIYSFDQIYQRDYSAQTTNSNSLST